MSNYFKRNALTHFLGKKYVFFLSCTLWLISHLCSAQVEANFVSTTLGDSCESRSVEFNASLSKGIITDYQWSVIDRSTNTEQAKLNGKSIFRIFSRTGSFKVVLTVFDNEGNIDSISKIINIYPNPVADFYSIPKHGCPQSDITLIDLSTNSKGNITTWEWNYGDGLKSVVNSGDNIIHNFKTAKQYSPTLIVTNEYGCTDANTKTNLIDIYPKIEPSFEVANTKSCNLPTTINIVNTSPTNNHYDYKWDFGDGNVLTNNSNSLNHTYTEKGNYKITLNAINQDSKCSAKKTTNNANSVYLGKPTADFTLPNEICKGQRVNLSLESDDNELINQVEWFFNDNNTSQTGMDVSHIFNKIGIWDVKLLAKNSFSGCNNDTVKHQIEVLDKPMANFTVDTDESCQVPLEVTFTNTSSVADRYEWNFRDGSGIVTTTNTDPVQHTFTDFGNSRVTLSVFNGNGCVARKNYNSISVQESQVNLVSPSTLCQTIPYIFRANATTSDPITEYVFDFSDGTNITQLEDSYIKAFPNAGNYTGTVGVETQNGCSATSSPKNINVSGYCYIDKYNSNHVAEIGGIVITKSDDCSEKYKFTFEDTVSSNTVVSWDFAGDVVTGNTNPITYTFPDNTGDDQFLITLKVIDSTNKTISRTFGVNILDEIGDISYTFNEDTVCLGTKITFTPEGYNEGVVSRFIWDFGNGKTLRIPSATGIVNYSYPEPGRYVTKLTILDKSGCEYEILNQDTVNVTTPEADFDFDENIFCSNDFQVNFTDVSTENNAGAIVERRWDFNDTSSVLTTTATTVTKEYLHQSEFRQYNVKLTVENELGCTATKQRTIKSYNPKADFNSVDTLLCGDLSVRLRNQSDARVTGNNQYKWYFGDGNTFSGLNRNYTYSDTGSYTVSLKVTDEAGCTDSISKIDYINLVDPQSDFIIGGDTSKCVGSFSLSFTAVSAFSNTYYWDFGDGTVTESNVKEVSHFYKIADVYNVSLITNGDNGQCIDTVTKEVRIKGPQGVLGFSDRYLCNEDSTLSVVTGFDVKNYIWDFGDGSNTADDLKNNRVYHKFKSPGIYRPTVVLQGIGNCEVTLIGDSIIVDNFDAGDTVNIECGDTYTQLQGFSALNLDSNYFWVGPRGGSFLPDNQELNAEVDVPGTYYLHANKSLCMGTDNVVVTTSGTIPIAGAGDDKKIDCIDSIAILDGFSDTPNVTYLWDGPLGAFSNGNDTLPTPTIRDTGQYVLKIQQKDCFTYDTVLVTECTLRARDTSISICANIPGLPFTYEDYDLTTIAQYVSTNVSSNVSWYRDEDFTELVPDVSNIEDGDKVFARIESLDGTEVARAKTDWFIYSYVNADILYTEDSICETMSPIVLTPQEYLGEDLTYKWYLNGALLNNLITPQELTLQDYPESGEYVLEVSNPFCDTEYDTVNAKIYENPVVYFRSPEISVVYENSDYVPMPLEIELEGPDSVSSISWEPNIYLSSIASDDGFDHSLQPGSIVTQPYYVPQDEEIFTTYRTVVTTGYNESTCEVEAEILVKNYKLVKVPNAFSPNGDGINDTWIISNLARYPNTTVRVFNRWGKKVFETKDGYNEPWDGRFNGKQLPFGTYYYAVELIGANPEANYTKSGALLIFGE